MFVDSDFDGSRARQRKACCGLDVANAATEASHTTGNMSFPERTEEALANRTVDVAVAALLAFPTVASLPPRPREASCGIDVAAAAATRGPHTDKFPPARPREAPSMAGPGKLFFGYLILRKSPFGHVLPRP